MRTPYLEVLDVMNMVENYRVIESKKYLWDGKTYDNESQAQEVKTTYEQNDFETHLVEDGGQYLVYTRRVVTEVVVEGDAPP